MIQLKDTFYVPRASLFKNIGKKWGNTSWATLYFYSVCMSQNGKYIYGCANTGRVWKSTNKGLNFIETRPSGNADHAWYRIRCSDDGKYVLVADSAHRLWLSSDYATSWTEVRPKGDADGTWYVVDVSKTGGVLLAGEYGGRLYISTGFNSSSWTEIRPKGDANGNWSCGRLDATGATILVGENSGRLYLSANTGSSFTEQTPDGSSDRQWAGAATSSDGSILYAAVNGRRVWKKSGGSWAEIRPVGDASLSWTGIDCDDTGNIVYCCDYYSSGTTGRGHVSLDGGTTFTSSRPQGVTAQLRDCAVGSNGEALAVCHDGGYIYYSFPFESTEPLPIVYGDLTDGTDGIWECPLIDPTNYVYCFAGHEVLSAANGNTVNIYKDGSLVSTANYTFDELNNYDSIKTIATITFTTDQGSSVITAQGKGKPTTTGGSTLMDNIVDIVSDFLTSEGGFSASLLDATAKARASQVFSAHSYKAAGIVREDNSYEDIITEQMASFLGSAFLNGYNKLMLTIDDGTVVQTGPEIMSYGECSLQAASMSLDDIINQCPAYYRYNYTTDEFDSLTDDDEHASLASQGIFGVRKPDEPYKFYWCRDGVAVKVMQDIIVGELAYPIYKIEIDDSTLKRIGLEMGDVVAFSAWQLYDSKGSPMWNQLWKLTAIREKEQDQGMIFKAIQTSYYMTLSGARDTTKY